MIEKTIEGIKYRLNEETLTAEVIEKEGYEGKIIIPETIVFNQVSYGVTSIGEMAFSGCSSLTSIVIPDSVTSIEESTFEGCSSLKQELIQEIEMNNFKYRLLLHNHCAIVVGYSREPKTIKIPAEINHKGVIYRVTSIGNSAFYACESLTSIVIPDSVTSIGDSAFWDCSSLTSIVIPDSVTSIGNSAFWHCSSLTSIVVAEGNTVYDSREQCNAIIHTATNTFIRGCQNTIIPDGVTSIGENAFYNCSFLTSITFNGTKAQWNSIELGDNWKWRIAAQRVRCTDGDVEI